MPKEFAPGIPIDREKAPIPKGSKPKEWEFVIQEHQAKKAGKHFDLRLGDPATGHGHSWALRKLPEPGQKVLAKQQATHTIPYFDFTGVISKGYGAGKVGTKMRTKAEVHRSDSGKVVFSIYNGKNISEYALIRVKDENWLLINRTPTRESWKVPSSKPKYKETKTKKIDFADDDKIMAAKIDGAHVTMHLVPGKEVRLFSYRPTERPSGVIDHTRRVTTLSGVRSPRQLGSTVLRGEIYARSKQTGKALPSEQVGGMLNANVWKSREKQKDLGKLRMAIFDVVRHKGQNLEGAGYEKKLEILQKVKKALPGIEIPRIAKTEQQKRKLLREIGAGREPSTREGVVLWDKKGERPIKSKIKTDYDVYIRKVLPGKKSGHAGAYAYSLTPRGKIVGNVGTGMSHSMRREMLSDPDKFIGMVAKVTAQKKFKSGALRAPSHQTVHLDKNPGDRLQEIEKLSYLIKRSKKKPKKPFDPTYIRTRIR
jgi:hypothetical protein